MRLTSMTKRGDRLSRTRRNLRSIRLASVAGVEKSCSAKTASMTVRMLLHGSNFSAFDVAVTGVHT